MLKTDNLFLRNFRLAGRLTAFFILAVLLVSGSPVPEAWLLVPGGASGAITASTTRRDLVDRYGAANVVDQDVALGEGETEPGTVVFPKDPQRLVEILWKDPNTKLTPESLRVSGRASLWKTVHGITLGTSLRQLESVNGRPFELFGFQWDYEGTVASWNNGVLGKELEGNGRVILRLSLEKETPVTRRELDEVQGDYKFSSGHPVMQKINPRIYQIIWEFP